MDIEFKENTGLGTKRLAHMLSFDDNGKTQSILLEVAGTGNVDSNIANTLAAQLDRLNVRGEEEKKQ